MASLNAGDPGLYVGGGTINLAFSGEIAQPEEYTLIHKQALMAARMGRPVRGGFASTSPVRLVQVTRSDSDPARGPVGAGTVFLDVFASPPHGVAENVAMLYLVPPNGADYPQAADFLAAVNAAARMVIAALATYNAAVSAGAASYAGCPPITDLRSCLFSGGQFRHPRASVDDVARTIAQGFDEAAGNRTTGLALIEFESGTGEFSALSPAGT